MEVVFFRTFSVVDTRQTQGFGDLCQTKLTRAKRNYSNHVILTDESQEVNTVSPNKEKKMLILSCKI